MVLDTSCYPYPPTTSSPLINDDSVKPEASIDPDSTLGTEEVLIPEYPSTVIVEGAISNYSRRSLEEEVPLRFGFKEHVDVIAEDQKSIFLKEMFLLDYQAIKSAYPNNPQRRLESSFFREALIRIMETEFYLTLISGQRTFERIYSEIPPHNKVNGYNFYEGIRQYHSHLQQRLNQSSLEIRKVMTHILLDTAIKLSFIESIETEQEKKSTEQDTSGTDNSNQLLEVMGYKNQVFANQSWTMILFEEVSDNKGDTLLLKDLIMQICDCEDLSPDDLTELAEISSQLLDHIHTKIQPSLGQASRQVLRYISGRVNLYRSKGKTLFVHDLVQQKTLKYLEDVQDHAALTAYNEFINQTSQPVTAANIAMVTGGFLICNIGRILSVPIAIMGTAANALDPSSLKQTFYRGAIFDLNSYWQYDQYDNSDFSGFIIDAALAAITAALICSGSRRSLPMSLLNSGPIHASRLSTTMGLFSRMSLNPQQLREAGRQLFKNLKEGVLDITALPTATASLVTFYLIERFDKCDEVMTLECHSQWDEEFVLLLSITFVTEFVFVFKSLNSGKQWFSNEHFQAMQDIARTVFGISLGTQAALDFIKDEDFIDVNYRLAFFQVIFGSLISLSTTKFVLLKMIDPFSDWLQRQTNYSGRLSATFSLMLLKNIFGNYLYLQGGHSSLESEQTTKDENKEEK